MAEQGLVASVRMDTLVRGFVSRELQLERYGTLGGFISGSFAGIAQSCILTRGFNFVLVAKTVQSGEVFENPTQTPVELVKTQLQVKTKDVGVSE